MNLKILFMLILYYTCISLFFSFAPINFIGYSSNVNLNDTAITGGEIDTGGVFTGGVSFTRFLGLVTVGVGLPSDTPTAFKAFFIIIQSGILLFTIGFFVDALWSG